MLHQDPAQRERLEDLCKEIEDEVNKNGRKASIGTLIRRIFAETGLRSGALAMRLGLSDQTIQRWMNNKGGPSLKQVISLRRAVMTECKFGVLPDDTPAHYIRAAASAKSPRLQLIEYLFQTEEQLGFRLSEETCVGLIADLERNEE